MDYIQHTDEVTDVEDTSIKNPSETIPNERFYEQGKKYYDKVNPDVNGMLGGFGHVSSSDVQGSTKFLKPFLSAKKNPVGHTRALDCGAGIGRVTKHFLLKHFDYVDMVEQNKTFLDESHNYITEDVEKIERRICSDLQSFTPKNEHYDVIWCQWVLSHLKDAHVIDFLNRCCCGLNDNGIIVIKDNVSSSGEVEIDEDDSTLSRPMSLWQDLIDRAGLTVIKKKKQEKFPKELYQVWMLACQPVTTESRPS